MLARKGDFTDWIAAGLDAGSAAVRIVDAENGDALPAYDDVAAWSSLARTRWSSERQPWSERAAAWLPGLVERAYRPSAFATGTSCWPRVGGEVGDNPNGREFGTISVELTAEAADDPLLGGLPARPPVQVCHTQSALTLPAGAAAGEWQP